MKHRFCTAIPAVAAFLVSCGGANQDSTPVAGTAPSQPILLGHVNGVGDDYNTVVEQLYVAYFGRPADVEGLKNFKAQLAAIAGPKDIQGLDTAYNTNTEVKKLIDSFGTSAESNALYGNQDTKAFVAAIYNNMLNRAPAQSGLDFWVNAIDSGFLTKGRAALSIMFGALTNSSQQGQTDAALVQNKISAATNFTHELPNADVYKGPTAAANARRMLSTVTHATDVTAFRPTIVETIGKLANPPTTPPALSPPASRSTANQPDDVAGAQVHVIYAVPLGAQDKQLDLSPSLVNMIGSMNLWLAAQTGGRWFKVDTFNGRLDVTYVQLPRSDADYEAFGATKRDQIEADLAAAGLIQSEKIYAVQYEGGNPRACAEAPYLPPNPPQVATVAFLQGTPGGAPCESNPYAASQTASPGYREFILLRLLLSTLGFVDPAAPNRNGGGVNNDPRDLMYEGPEQWTPGILDVSKTNYYNPGGLSSGIKNLADSPYLTPRR